MCTSNIAPSRVFHAITCEAIHRARLTGSSATSAPRCIEGAITTRPRTLDVLP